MRFKTEPEGIDHYPAGFEEKMLEIKDGYSKIIEAIKKDSKEANIKDRSIIYRYKNKDIVDPSAL